MPELKLKLSDNVKLPTDAVTERFAILGRTGAGKSYGCRVLAEELLDAHQFVVIIDPKGDAWGIRSSADGKKNGYPVLIMGGAHSDVPLLPNAGQFAAEFLVRERVSTILDVSDFGEAEMARFVADFGNTFYRLNREAVHLIVDEADEFAPQSGYSGPVAQSLGAMQRLQRRGRGRGIGVTLLTQRSAVINKSVLTQAGTLIAMQASHPRDLEPVEEWLSANATKEAAKLMRSEVPHLKVGEAFILSPHLLGPDPIRFRFRAIRTFDSMRTPRPGEARQVPKRLADVDLAGVQKSMAAQIEQAKANDPAELRKQIAELKRQAKGQTPAVVDPEAVNRAVAAAVKQSEKTWQAAVNERDKIIGGLTGRLGKIANLAHVNGEAVPKAVAPVAVPRPVVSRPVSMVRQPREATGDTSLGRADRAILRAAYWLRDESSPSKQKIAFYADYSSKSSGTDKALSNLRTLGLMSGMTITEEGIAALGDVPEKPHGMELREWLRGHLGQAENAILDALIASHPERLTKEQVAERSGYSDRSSGTDKALSNLRTIEAAEGSEKSGGTKAADVFFE